VLFVLLGGRLQPVANEPPPSPLGTRLLWFPVFAAAVVVDVVQGTFDVALRVLSVRRLEAPGVVRVPIGERSDRGAAVAGLASSLSPGSVLVDIDWERRDLLFHVIDASDPDALRARQQRFYDRYQRRVFP
jgi:multicomponent K+:H+ antiporter subunit E/multicomponent Na+:H+ antiporter subunit E